jgi:carboxyl-terminal processing protease
MRFLAHAVPGSGQWAPLPLAVLVNRGTTGSAEIVAAAVQDHGHGAVVGTPTAGLGTINTIWPLPDGSGLSLPTARYFRPRGASLSAGVTPDIVVVGVGEPGCVPDPQLERAVEALRATRR